MKSWSKGSKDSKFQPPDKSTIGSKRTLSGLLVYQKGKQLLLSFKKTPDNFIQGSPSPASCLAHSTKFSFSFHYQKWKWNHLTVRPKISWVHVIHQRHLYTTNKRTHHQHATQCFELEVTFKNQVQLPNIPMSSPQHSLCRQGNDHIEYTQKHAGLHVC